MTLHRVFASLTFLAGILTLRAAPPDILLLIPDDLGRTDTSVHGSADVRTPTLERLAARGMVFDNAYVASPSCCPNRFSLLTGLMPARHGAHPNHSKPHEKTRFLSKDMADLGYHLASFGKIAHGSREFPGLQHLSKPAEGMSRGIEKIPRLHIQSPHPSPALDGRRPTAPRHLVRTRRQL